MESLVVRIDKPKDGNYPITLLRWSPDEKKLLQTGISGSIPVGLDAGKEDGYRDETTMCEDFFQATGVTADLIQMGTQLHRLLFQGPVGEALLTPNQRVLLDVRDPALQKLPWELISSHDDNLYHFRDPARPFARGTINERKSLPPQGWPLRMLIVTGLPDPEPQAADNKLQGMQEREVILSTLTPCDPDVDIEILKLPTYDQLSTCISEFKPHILHFIGHGRAAAIPYLELSPGGGDESKWFAPLIQTSTSLFSSLRLVVLNACRSSDIAAMENWSIADAFTRAGVPAVVGMRCDVTGDQAVIFSRCFYGALAQGKTIDVAMTEAREKVFNAKSGPTRRNWAAPSLHLLRPPEEILIVGAGVKLKPERRLLVRDCFKEFRKTVDRRKERHAAWQVMAEQQNNLLVIHGLTRVGKTHLAQLFIERCMLADFNVRYVNFNQYIQRINAEKERKQDAVRVNGTFLTLLRAIRDDIDIFKSPLSAPLEMADFAPFNRRLNEITGAEASDVDAYKELDEEELTRYSQVNDKRHPAAELIPLFCQCLENIAGRMPLVIVLDQLKLLLPSDFTGLLRKHFVDWCLHHQQIRLVLVLENTEFNEFKIETLLSKDSAIPLASFSREEWNELAMEFLYRLLPDRDLTWIDMARPVIVGLSHLHNTGPWNPDELDIIRQVARWVR